MERLNANTPTRTPTRTPTNQGISQTGNLPPVRPQATVHLTVAPDNNVTPINRTSAVPPFMPIFTPEVQTQNAPETPVVTATARQLFSIPDSFDTQPSSLPPRTY